MDEQYYTLCAGVGQGHTDRFGEELNGITLEEVRELVDNPQEVSKEKARWMIPSTLRTRQFSAQEERGRYWILWADIDRGDKSLDLIRDFAEKLSCDYEVYSSRSAKENDKKWRLLIPMARNISNEAWRICQQILNNTMAQHGLTPDRSSERAGQLCYLPNKGEFYQSYSEREGVYFNPDETWAEEIAAELKRIDDAENARKLIPPKPARITRIGASPIDAFNSANSIEDLLAQAGYKRRKGTNSWCHPNSQSGSYSAGIKDNRVHSLSTSDPLYSAGNGAHDAFSVYCILTHNGDVQAATRAVAPAIEDYDEPVTFVADIDYSDVADSKPVKNDKELPGFCDSLLNLPGALGELQDYIHGAMVFPDRPIAAISALAFATHYASTKAIVDTIYGGLCLHEYYVVMARTGFGKESLRRALDKIDEELTAGYFGISAGASIQRALPASPQGLHKLLENNRAQTFMSDEFAEWLVQSTGRNSNPHRQGTIGYLMELYTKGLGNVCVPQAVTTKYEDVQNPRVSIFATTTGERMAESMSLSQAESGLYNRFVPFVATQERIIKTYTKLNLAPGEGLLSWFRWMLELEDDTTMALSKEAFDHFVDYDHNVVEDIKFHDPVLAGRLTEQAFKISALIALSRKSMEISKNDLELAYKIRMSIYERSKAFLMREGGLTGEDVTVKAFEQLREALNRNGVLYASKLINYSRAYKSLSQHDREKTLEALGKWDGAIRKKTRKGGIVIVKKT